VSLGVAVNLEGVVVFQDNVAIQLLPPTACSTMLQPSY